MSWKKSCIFAVIKPDDMGKLELVMETEKVSIYSPKYDGEANNEFEKFMLVNSAYANPQL